MVQFKYIKPDEVEEYLRRGYKIERGPRGGIKAYSPDVSRATSEDAFMTILEVTDESPVYRVAVDNAYFWLMRKKNVDMGLSFVAQIVFGIMKPNPEGAEKITNAYWGSKENFEAWVEANIIEVKDEEKIHDYQLLSNNAFEINGKFVVFKPVVMHTVSTELKHENFGTNMEKYIWRGSGAAFHDAQNSFNGVKEQFESMLGGDNLQRVFEDIDNLTNGLVELTRDILYSDAVLVDDERIGSMVESLWGEVEQAYVSFENILEDDIDFVNGFVGDYSARLVSVYFLFRKLGASKEEAMSLAKGWEATRFWTGSLFKVFTHDVEELIVRCNGNGRLVRVNVDAINEKEELGKLFFKMYVDCNSFNSWRKFVQMYLRKFYNSDTVTIYRGVRYREVLMGLMDFIESGEVKIGGVAESATVDLDIASEWASDGWVAKSTIPVEYAVGCWLNASALHAEDEAEVTIEKPRGGLPVEFMNTNGNFVERIFEDTSWVLEGNLKEWCEKNGYDYEAIERSLQGVLANGVLGICDLYWENEEFMKEFIREFVDIVRNLGWEDLFNDNDEGVELDDLIAEYLEEDNEFGFGDVSRYVDELMAKVTELKKERRFKYIKPEEVEEYKARGYDVKEGPKGGIRAYFPDVKGDVDTDMSTTVIGEDELEGYLEALTWMGREDLSSMKLVDKIQVGIILRKAYNSFRYENDVNKGLSYVAAVILEHPDIFGDYIESFWDNKESFDAWVKKNVIYVKDKSFASAIVGRAQIFDAGGKIITFREILKSSIKSRINSHNLFLYVWFRNEMFVKDFVGDVESLKASIDKAFDGGSEVLDDVVSKVVKMASVVEDVLNQEPVDVDETKIRVGVGKFNDIVKERMAILESMHGGDWNAVNEGYFSFENLFGDLLDEAEDYMDKFSARLFIFATAFMKMGFSREEAYSLAKGWELARFWTGETFKTYTHYVEKMIVECKGNGRPVRKPYRKPNDYGFVFFNKYASCKDLENWRKFVQAYLREKYGDEIRIYRGVRAREVGQAVIDYILEGEVRLGGIAESSTVDEEEAGEWGWGGWVFATELPVEYVIGCWLNASRNYADKEKEIMFEKPPGGLAGIMTNYYDDSLSGIFDADIFDDPALQEDAIDIMEEGLRSIKRTYGEDSEHFRMYKDKMIRAKSILMGETIKGLVKSIGW